MFWREKRKYVGTFLLCCGHSHQLHLLHYLHPSDTVLSEPDWNQFAIEHHGEEGVGPAHPVIVFSVSEHERRPAGECCSS